MLTKCAVENHSAINSYNTSYAVLYLDPYNDMYQLYLSKTRKKKRMTKHFLYKSLYTESIKIYTHMKQKEKKQIKKSICLKHAGAREKEDKGRWLEKPTQSNPCLPYPSI